MTVKVKKQEVVVEKDEHPRPETTIEGLCKLPVLFRKGGVVTAGNSSVSFITMSKCHLPVVFKAIDDIRPCSRIW